LRAVHDVSFEVRFGEIVALIGPNGAGKSTMFNVISGIEIPTSGRILLEGRDLSGVPIHQRAVVIGRSFQVPRLVPDLTAIENVVSRLDHMPGQRDEAEGLRIGTAQLEAFGLSGLADVPVNQIGLSHHKLIELVRASAGQPPLLLLDEPAVGLTVDEVTRLAELLALLKRQGAAILVVEHNVGFVSTVADVVVVMESGRLIARGAPPEVMADEKVKDAYLGALT
jgi:branched-chain amino acid transport system permease protein